MKVKVLRRVPLMAALALCALPAISPAGEAPATSAASQQDAEKRPKWPPGPRFSHCINTDEAQAGEEAVPSAVC